MKKKVMVPRATMLSSLMYIRRTGVCVLIFEPLISFQDVLSKLMNQSGVVRFLDILDGFKIKKFLKFRLTPRGVFGPVFSGLILELDLLLVTNKVLFLDMRMKITCCAAGVFVLNPTIFFLLDLRILEFLGIKFRPPLRSEERMMLRLIILRCLACAPTLRVWLVMKQQVLMQCALKDIKFVSLSSKDAACHLMGKPHTLKLINEPMF